MLIAGEGYNTSDTRIFAPPLYPWLMRLAGGLLGGNEGAVRPSDCSAILLGGLIVSNLACMGLFAYLYRLAEMEWGTAIARRTVVYLALFPSAFFLLAAYAESLFMLCAVAAFYHARRRQWLAAGLWGGCAPLARLPGIAILLPLGWEFARQWWVSRCTASKMLAIQTDLSRAEAGERPLASHKARLLWHGWPLILVVVGGILFPLYAYLVVGSDGLLAPFAIHTQRFMGRFALPWHSLWMAVRALASGSFRFIEPFDLAFALLFIGLTAVAFFRLPSIYALYMAVMLVGSLTKVSAVQPLLSLSRYVLVLFPGFVLLAQLGQRNAWWNRLIVYLSVAGAIFFVGQFAIWGWVG
jgi:hypothetical protein